LETRYLEYLDDLADKTEAAFESSEMLDTSDEIRPAYEFWRKNRDVLWESDATALFFIDALRSDLAHELADKLSGEKLEVEESIWRGMLPSETKFGMSAPLPLEMRSFNVEWHDGELQPRANGRTIDKQYREEILKGEGWQSTDNLDEDVWEARHVAYFDTSIDDLGENDLDELESLLASRIEKLADDIRKVMLDRGREKVFVVTDHGFVLLPDNDIVTSRSAPTGASDIHRRRAAGEDLEETHGVRLGDNGHTLKYLQQGVDIDLLVNPRHRFKKQGVTDDVFFHGGGLPQECILTFLEIEKI
jgi:hypothetical protein